MKVKKKTNTNPSSSCNDPDSVLKLLPVAILALAFSLPNHDREVLAYLISRSVVTSINTTSKIPNSRLKNKCKTSNSEGRNKCVKKIPLFQCGCFDCYTSFWYRWDSSPNRELIHQVIEAFEEHLLQNECPRKHSKGRKRGNGNKVIAGTVVESDIQVDNKSEISVGEHECEEEVASEKGECGGESEENGVVCEEDEKVTEVKGNLEMEVVTLQCLGAKASHKGLARKVLPDVVGLLNSRLWSFWSPGI